MATYASRPAWEVRARALTRARVAVPAGLGLLALLSVLLRFSQLGIGFWIDEGLSVGIADRPLTDIPSTLRQDGSPPLYYSLLHGWIRVFGTSEVAARSLSLLFATLAVPASWWAARVLFSSERAGWVAAVLSATNAFLTEYAQEARMYALIALLGTLACGCLGRALSPDAGAGGHGVRRPWAIGSAVALAAMIYTHNWALFFTAAWGLAWLVLLRRSEPGAPRRELREAGLIAFGGAALLWLPWVPTFLYQATHTGAPWSRPPSILSLIGAPGQLIGPVAQGVLIVTAGAGVATLLAGADRRRARTVLLLLAVGAGTLAVAWIVSQVSPAWARRYYAVGLAPFVLGAAGGLAYAGRLGIAGLVLAAVVGIANGAPGAKSNVRDVAEAIAPSVDAGDVLVSTWPEQVPVLHHYLSDGLRFATPMGPVADVGVTDWRNGTQRLEAATPRKDLQPLLDGLPRGGRLILVMPIFSNLDRWQAPWTKAIRLRSYEWQQYMSNRPDFRMISIEPPPPVLVAGPLPVQATIYVKMRR